MGGEAALPGPPGHTAWQRTGGCPAGPARAVPAGGAGPGLRHGPDGRVRKPRPRPAAGPQPPAGPPPPRAGAEPGSGHSAVRAGDQRFRGIGHNAVRAGEQRLHGPDPDSADPDRPGAGRAAGEGPAGAELQQGDDLREVGELPPRPVPRRLRQRGHPDSVPAAKPPRLLRRARAGAGRRAGHVRRQPHPIGIGAESAVQRQGAGAGGGAPVPEQGPHPGALPATAGGQRGAGVAEPVGAPARGPHHPSRGSHRGRTDRAGRWAQAQAAVAPAGSPAAAGCRAAACGGAGAMVRRCTAPKPRLRDGLHGCWTCRQGRV
mmetsp:Transcript_102556/g.290416  ORF Transcript_102556/g.290416 Transcript_102556/m.290416 type:complete len:318 (+) Transcript_102556:570-1523(+)